MWRLNPNTAPNQSKKFTNSVRVLISFLGSGKQNRAIHYSEHLVTTNMDLVYQQMIQTMVYHLFGCAIVGQSAHPHDNLAAPRQEVLSFIIATCSITEEHNLTLHVVNTNKLSGLTNRMNPTSQSITRTI